MAPPFNPGQLLRICAQPVEKDGQPVENLAKLSMIPMHTGYHEVGLTPMTGLFSHGFKQQRTAGDRLGMALRDSKPRKQRPQVADQ
jgi:hypothetical protein